MGPHQEDAVVVARDVHKTFGQTQALAGLDLTVPTGTVYGLLGPNGAGKSTAVRVFATLTRPDSGDVTVAGHNVATDAAAVRRRIGLAGQHAALDEELTGRENLRVFGRLFQLGAARSRQRAEELLERFNLAFAAHRPVRTYSGGMRRRLDLIASLIVSPTVLFLDEPTTGLDPQSRNEIWDTVRELVLDGTTVLLTTQYLDEADQLADHVAVIDTGRVIASGTPAELKARIGGRIDVTVSDESELTVGARALSLLTSQEAEPDLDVDHRLLSIPVSSNVSLPDVVRQLDHAGVNAVDAGIRQPTLDEVFLTLTGAPQRNRETV